MRLRGVTLVGLGFCVLVNIWIVLQIFGEISKFSVPHDNGEHRNVEKSDQIGVFNVQPCKVEKNYYYSIYFDRLPYYFDVTMSSLLDVYGEVHIYTNLNITAEIEGVYFHYINKQDYIPSFVKNNCEIDYASDIARLRIAEEGTEYDNYYYFDMDIIHFKKITHCNWLAMYADGDDISIVSAAFCFKKGNQFLKKLLQEINNTDKDTLSRVAFGPELLSRSFHKYQPNEITTLPLIYDWARKKSIMSCYQSFFHPIPEQKNRESLNTILSDCKAFLKQERNYKGKISCEIIEQ